MVGGILVAWNTEVVEVLDSMVGDFSVSVLCKEDGMKWAFSSVYGPADQSDFSGVKSKLDRVCEALGVPWCMGGGL